MPPAPHTFSFPRAHRLSGNNQFAAVYQAKMRKNAGPIAVLTKPNDLPHNRLGLSVSRKVGNAIIRNRIKRLLRDAYRLTQHDQPKSYDIIIAPRPTRKGTDPKSQILTLVEYQTHLLTALTESHQNWQRRLK
ncbi:Ribonuclease P protein component [Poriferisphaera corsica]|uniref:Ribonuclease P protein component n=1 Tax=Poriferisphaera corsica TaxID=2528020 RepID=A0A517YWI3_9BACT|nr:ribonuclease P protein component [Poriferisphaera corsica]QDU34590.1 Ribonuclease P protein component [Poriferisphaera corsica]